MFNFAFKPSLRGPGSLSTTSLAKIRPRTTQGPKKHALLPPDPTVSKQEYQPAANFAVVRAADANFNKIANAYIQLVNTVKEKISTKELAKAFETRNLSEVFSVLNLDELFEKVGQGATLQPEALSLVEALQGTFKAGAEAEVTELKSQEVQKASIGVEMIFDLLNPEAIAWLTNYSFNLIRAISKDAKIAIQNIILDAFQKGGHPYTQAQRIKGFIGLTATQAQAVKNFRDALESGNKSQLNSILNRALRDKRFDKSIINAINNATPIDQFKIDDMVKRYQERYLKYRAETIARTETIRASVAGQQNTWKQAQQQGLIKKDKSRQFWSVTKDDKLCEQCREVPKLNKNGVALGEVFKTPIGDSSGPPLHPNCRCIVVMRFKK